MKKIIVLLLSAIIINARFEDCVNKKQGNYIFTIRPDGCYYDLRYGVILRLSYCQISNLMQGKKTYWEVISITYDCKKMVSPYRLEGLLIDRVVYIYGEFNFDYDKLLFKINL